MDVIYTHCAGLDVHKKSLTACRWVPDPTGHCAEGLTEIETFGTMTIELLGLVDWLTEAGITHVAMESTGEYWHPVYNLLEGHFTVLLVNAAHVKNVPGRKTDKADARWLAKLLRHGLLQASFIPPRGQRDVRDLTRYRTKLVQERAREVNRVQGVLERANIKLASVVSDVMGVSSRAILAALVDGRADPATMAELARALGRQPVSPRGLESLPAMMKAPGNGAQGKLARGTVRCGRGWCNWLTVPRIPRRRIWRRSSAGWPHAGGSSARLSLSPTPSWSVCFISSSATSYIGNSLPPILTGSGIVRVSSVSRGA